MGYALDKTTYTIVITPTYNELTGELKNYTVRVNGATGNSITFTHEKLDNGTINTTDNAANADTFGINNTPLITLPETGGAGMIALTVAASCLNGRIWNNVCFIEKKKTGKIIKRGQSRMKESVRKTLMFLMAVGFLTGFALLLYPMFSNMWNEYNSKLKFEEYQHENAEKAEDTSLEEEWEKAAAYNERLQPIVIPDSFIQAEQEEVTQQDSEYMSCLNQNGDGMMGYLSIPKIGEIIPVYHTSREEVLQKGAGHIQGSSLPIGGTSTHASIAAHRGIPGMSLFTDLDLLEEGDQFYLYILDEILAYEVDR